MVMSMAVNGYGKIYEKLYEGSMVGKGLGVFALMPYVIAKQYPESRDQESPMLVKLNAALLAGIFGAEEAKVQEAIDFLCGPDMKTTTEGEGGRRLVRVGQFEYRVVNGRYYRGLADAERLRDRNARAQARHRIREKARALGVPLLGEGEYVAAVEDGKTEEELGEIVAKWLPKRMGKGAA